MVNGGNGMSGVFVATLVEKEQKSERDVVIIHFPITEEKIALDLHLKYQTAICGDVLVIFNCSKTQCLSRSFL